VGSSSDTSPEPGWRPRDRSLGHGIRWSFVNTVVTRLTGILVTMIVVRIVTPKDFGTFAVALVVYTIAAGLSELGLSVAIVRRSIDFARGTPVVSALSIVSGVLGAALMLCLSGPLATTLGAPAAAPAIRLMSVGLLISAVTAVPTALLVRDFRQGRIFAATSIAFIPSNLVLILLALHGDGAMAFAWSRIVGLAVSATVVIAGAWPWPIPRWERALAKEILVLGLPMAGANFINYALLNADSVLIGATLGPAALGIYTLAFNVASWSTSIIGGTINGVALPALAAIRREPPQLRLQLSRWTSLTALIALPIAAVTIVLSPQLIRVLYGSRWDAAAPVLSILSIYGGIFALTLFLSNLLVAIGRTVTVLFIQITWFLALVGAIYLGVNLAGVRGAAVAHVAVIALIIVPTYLWAIRRYIDGAPYLLLKAVAIPLLIALGSGGAAYLSSWVVTGAFWRLLLGGFTGGLVWVTLGIPVVFRLGPPTASAWLRPVMRIYPRRLLWNAEGSDQ